MCSICSAEWVVCDWSKARCDLRKFCTCGLDKQ